MLKITYPLPYQVVQRGLDNQASVEVRGTCDTTADDIQVRFVPHDEKLATTTPWFRVGRWLDTFSGMVPVPAGWWRIEVQQLTRGEVTCNAFQGCFGVGEVFLVFGHSIAQGGGPFTKGATDWRVSTIDHSSDALLEPLPFAFKQLADNTKMAPFGGAPYAWAKLGDLLAKRLNLPILFYNCAHGGTNIEQAWKSIMRIPFEHGFCRFYTGQPYRPVALAFQDYVPRTGLRAVLCQHGINDDPNNDAFYKQLLDVIHYTKKTFNVPKLGWMHMLESKPGVVGFEKIQAAIRRLWKEEPNVHPGPDFAEFTKISVCRPDSIHLTCEEDLALYAGLWDRMLTEEFFKTCEPVAAGTTPPMAEVVR